MRKPIATDHPLAALAAKLDVALRGLNPDVRIDGEDIRVELHPMGAALISIDYTSDASNDADDYEWIVGVTDTKSDEALETVSTKDVDLAIRLARAMHAAARLSRRT